MKKKIVFKTNVMICGVAAVAFLLATALSGYAGFMAAKVDSGPPTCWKCMGWL